MGTQERKIAGDIVRELKAKGHVALFAGGCVRDELLGNNPADYDIATDATPEQIKKIFPRTAHVGAAFGVVLVTKGRTTIEVATFRADGPYSDRRHPDSVTYADMESDAKRRDFTVNALFLDPDARPDPVDQNLGAKGHVIDLVGGIKDLENRILRAVGNPDDRLAEDHLRALRAARFAARLGFTIEPGTAWSIRTHARDLVGVSRERIGEELRRMLEHPSRLKAIETLTELDLDSPILNEPAHPGPWPLLEVMDNAKVQLPLALAAWALDRHGFEVPIQPVVRRWRTALALSNEERDLLSGALERAVELKTSWGKVSVAQRKRWAAATPLFEWSLLLNSLNPKLVRQVKTDVESLKSTPSGLKPEPLLNGHVLIQEGFTPSPSFGPILHAIYDLQLEGQITTRSQAIAKARELESKFGV